MGERNDEDSKRKAAATAAGKRRAAERIADVKINVQEYRVGPDKDHPDELTMTPGRVLGIAHSPDGAPQFVEPHALVATGASNPQPPTQAGVLPCNPRARWAALISRPPFSFSRQFTIFGYSPLKCLQPVLPPDVWRPGVGYRPRS
jgi:hypothetical protein